MPRIYASNNDPIDFCIKHFPSEAEAKRRLGNIGDGPDGRGNCFEYDAAHPDYLCDEYRCYECGKLLTDQDDDTTED